MSNSRQQTPSHSTTSLPTVADPVASSPSAATEIELEPGKRLGRYLVLHRAGAGSMGVVYAAYDPELDRRVAIKLLHTRSWNQAGQNRVLQEARAMAKLNHPHVVSVFDVGTLGDQLFVAMEFVEGATLRNWLAAAPRTWRQVADVMAGAARGLAAAHDAGIVHRDVKPMNIIVTPSGDARVLDFGVARAANTTRVPPPESGVFQTTPPPSESQALQTGAEVAGTPAYMAPEQFKGIATPLSDQYAFCVTLHEALFGHRPAPVDLASLTRGDRPGRAAPELDRGLVRGPSAAPTWLWRVVRRGLSIDPQERHASMHVVAELLSQKPEQRRMKVIAASAIGASLVIAAVAASRELAHRNVDPCADVASAGARVFDAAQQKALHSAFGAVGRSYAIETADRVADLLLERTNDWSSMRRDACAATWTQHTQSQQLFDLRMACLDRRLSEQRALTQLFTHGVDADVVDKSIQAARSLPPLSSCSDTRTLLAAYPPPSDPQTFKRVEALEASVDEAKALRLAGRFDAAVATLSGRQAEVQKLAYPPLSAELGLELASSQAEAGDAEGAEKTLNFVALPEAARAKDDNLLATAIAKWAFVVGYLEDRHAEVLAVRPLAEAAAIRAGENSTAQAELLTAVGGANINKGDYAAARQDFERAAQLMETLYGPDDPRRGRALNNLGLIIEYQSKHQEALKYLEQAVSVWERTLGKDHPSVALGLNNLGLALQDLGRDAEARSAFERALSIWEQAHGPNHADVGMALANLANVARREGRLDDAKKLAERALDIRAKVHGESNHRAAMSMTELAAVLIDRKEFAESQRVLEAALQILDKALAPDHPFAVEARFFLAKSKLALGHPQEAVNLLEAALDVAQKQELDSRTEIEIALAQALWASKSDRPRALFLAQKARDALLGKEALIASERALLREVTEWLEHPA